MRLHDEVHGAGRPLALVVRSASAMRSTDVASAVVRLPRARRDASGDDEPVALRAVLAKDLRALAEDDDVEVVDLASAAIDGEWDARDRVAVAAEAELGVGGEAAEDGANPNGRDRVPASTMRSAAPMLGNMTIQRMDHVGVVVDDLEGATAFFVRLGMELEVEMPVEGRWVDLVVGLDGVRVDIAMMRTPDGHGRLELTKFHTPTAVSAEPNAPENTLGIRRIMFAVDDIEDVLARLRAHGAELVGELAQYEDSYRLCYVRGPEGIIVALAEQLN